MNMSTSGRHRLAVAVLAGVLTLPVLAGCGSGHGASPSASPSTMPDAQILALGRQVAQCIREHGIPGLPDPTVENGRLILPVGAVANIPDSQIKAAQNACQSIIDQLPSSALGGTGDRSRAPLSATDLAKVREWAKCVRQHGLSDFPDPRPDGTFDSNLTLPAMRKMSYAQLVQTMDACQQYWVPNTSLKG
jgi:hypothetical protein